MTRDTHSPAVEMETLASHCQQLRLTRVGLSLSTLLEQAAQQELSYSAFLTNVLATEVAAKQEKHHAMRIQMARFPFQKTLEGFDWKAQPSIDPKVIKELATMRFVANGANALLLGPPGVGKTHLSVALGMEACRLGLRVMFTTATALITTLGKALYENRLEERLKLLTQPKLLIIDEIGYIPIDRQGANLFFCAIPLIGAVLLTDCSQLAHYSSAYRSRVVSLELDLPLAAPQMSVD